MALSIRDEEFSAFVRTSRPELLRSARLLAAGDSHLAEDLVQTALARLYVAWPKVRRTGTQHAYAGQRPGSRIFASWKVSNTRRSWNTTLCAIPRLVTVSTCSVCRRRAPTSSGQ
jgi:Sigma-70 region 2